MLGRLVEQVWPQNVDTLRAEQPLRTGDAGRRVCDGVQVLARSNESLRASASADLTDEQGVALDELRAAVDAYGDLLVADAVFDVVSGRGETAGAAMDAAAGLELPPDLDVLRTQRAGRTVTTTVLAVLPAASPPPSTDRPVQRASPAVAAFLDAELPPATDWTWSVRRPGTVTTVTLADLAMKPADPIALTPDQLRSLVLLNAPGAAEIVDAGGSAHHERALRLARVLAGRPASPADLTVDAAADRLSGQPAPDDSAVLADLRARHAALRTAAEALLGELSHAASPGTAALARAARWGIVPTVPPGTADPLGARLRMATEAVAERLRRVPDDGVLAAQTVTSLSDLIVGLAAPGSPLPVFGRVTRADLPRGPDDLEPAAVAHRDWQETVAAVRPPVARLEAHQLDADLRGTAALRMWTNRPGDPWHRSDGSPRPPAHLVAYGPAGALDGTDVAVAVLDSWSETMPGTEHTAAAAFGFNAPAARAPQAILVAVTPVPGEPITAGMALDIVAETRQLAHARTATPADVGDASALLPLTYAPARASTRFGLELAEWERDW